MLEMLAQIHNLQLHVSGAQSVLNQEVDVSAGAATFEDLLSQLLASTGLSYRVDDGVLYISDSADVQIRYIQINYADADELLELIAGNGILSDQGSVMLDRRTNTLIVRDEPAGLAQVDVLLTELDVPVSQVLIEARIVSASLDTGRELGVRWGATSLSAAAGSVVDNSQFALELGHRDAGSVTAALIRDSRLLEWELSLLERRGQAELIARPRVMTQDNSPASISSGVRIPYQAQAGGTAGGSITQFVDAVLSLDVKPLITPDGRIIMDLSVRQDSVASGSGDTPAIDTNTVQTRVLIDNADTLVLGGIFREEQTEAVTGTPGLRSVPVIGPLFRRTVASERRTELLIFITPTIIPAP
ncbi:MAG TPA: hypothetical protein DD407_03170 [Pseudohongiella sp.]|nr:hypothetical protein [Pseudohongiella sp.]